LCRILQFDLEFGQWLDNLFGLNGNKAISIIDLLNLKIDTKVTLERQLAETLQAFLGHAPSRDAQEFMAIVPFLFAVTSNIKADFGAYSDVMRGVLDSGIIRQNSDKEQMTKALLPLPELMSWGFSEMWNHDKDRSEPDAPLGFGALNAGIQVAGAFIQEVSAVSIWTRGGMNATLSFDNLINFATLKAVSEVVQTVFHAAKPKNARAWNVFQG